ncbi:MAG: LysE family transporter [Pyramidobacter sp.]|jgi:cysteine/O-acetylserine efflux protein
MMLRSAILAYLPYALATAFSPGLNNVLFICSVSRHGWKKSRYVLLGIASGFLCMMILCALFCYQLAKRVPQAAEYMEYIGAVYILWLAYRVAVSRIGEGNSSAPETFIKSFLGEFLNVKIVLYAMTVYMAYVLPRGAGLCQLMVHAVILTVIGALGYCTWGVAGSLFGKTFREYYRPFNVAMAFVLLWCAGSLLFG